MINEVRPLWFAAVVFGAGILTAWWWPVSPVVAGALVTAVWAAGLALGRGGRGQGATTMLWLCCFSTGLWWRSLEVRETTDPGRLGARLESGEIVSEEPVMLTGRLRGWPEPAPRRVHLEIEVEEVGVPASVVETRGRVRCVLGFFDQRRAVDWERSNFRPGDKVRVSVSLHRNSRFRNPGGAEFSEYLDGQGYDALGTIKDVPVLVERGNDRTLSARLGLIRLRALRLLERDFDPPTAGLLAASLLGNRYFLDADWSERFRRTNTFHLLVISGSHLALIGWISALALGRLTRRKWVVAVVVTALVWLYAVLVGADPPVARAAVAITVWQIAGAAYRTPDPLNVLGAAILVLLIGRPSQLFHPGFQLTAGAAAVLVGGVAPMLATLKSVGSWRPTRGAPRPPDCPRPIRLLAETLFWSPLAFERETAVAPVKYRLEKCRLADILEKCCPVSVWPAGPEWLRRANLQTVSRWAFVLFTASAAVQVGLLPLQAGYFNRVAPVGAVSNLVAEVMMGVVVILSPVYFAACFLGAGTASMAAWPLSKAVSGFVAVAGLGGTWPGGSFRVPHLEGWRLLVYAVFAVACVGLCAAVRFWNPFGRRGNPVRRRWGRIGLAAAVAAAVVFGGLSVEPPRRWTAPPPGRMRVTFLDVGQGDSTLIEFPNGQTMLIDAGGRADFGRREKTDDPRAFREDAPGVGERVVSRALWALGIRRLDVVVATHADADHIQGFDEVLENFPVGEAWRAAAPSSDSALGEWLGRLTKKGVPVRRLSSGSKTTFGDCQVEALSPGADDKFESDNENSLVLKITCGRRSFLLTGDIEARAELRLVERGNVAGCDVLKAPHHGSKSSSTPEFIDAVRPGHVVFCAPRKSVYGHPHPEIVKRYGAVPGIRTWQTGIDGAVTFETDGNELRAWSFASERTVSSEK